MTVVFSRARKFGALATSAILAAGLLSAVGFGAASAQADDAPGSVDILVSAGSWGLANDADVTVFQVTGTGSSTKLDQVDGGNTGNDTDGTVSFDDLVVGAKYVFEVTLDGASYTSPDDNAPGAPFATTWFGSTGAPDSADAGTYTATSSDSLTIPLDTGYSISGTVTGAEDVQFAEAYLQSTTDPTEFDQDNYANVDNSEDTYTITGLRPGTYKLRFSVQDGGTDATTYSGGAATLAAASTVTLGESDLTGQDVTMISDSYSITGTLENPDGSPVDSDSTAWASLYEADGVSQAADDSVPSENPDGSAPGAISFANLPAGDYVLETFSGNDHLTAPFGTYYNNKLDATSATRITVPGVDASGIEAKLSSGFSLTGKLTSATGTALTNATVSLFPVQGSFTDADSDDYSYTDITATTDSHGNYSFGAVAPGSYYVQLDGTGTGSFQEQYLDGTGTTTDRASATPLTYTDGAQSLNLSLLPISTVDIHVVSATGAAISSAYVSVDPVVHGQVDNTDAINAAPVDGKPGYYEANNVDSSGTYTAYIETYSAAGELAQYLGGSSTPDGAKTFTVRAGLNTIDATLATPAKLSGVVTNKATGKALAGVLVSLYTFDGKNWVPYVYDYSYDNVRDGVNEVAIETTSKGAYSFAGLQPGSYKVEFGAFPGDPQLVSGYVATQTTVPQFSGAAATLAAATPVYVSAKTPVVVNAAMTTGGILNGVLTSGGVGINAAQVIPYYLGADGNSTPIADYDHSAITSKKGAYSVSGLAPGVWKLAYVVNPLAVGAYSGYVGGSTLATATAFTVTSAAQTVATVSVPSPSAALSTVNVTFVDSNGDPVSNSYIEADLVPTSGPSFSKCSYNYYVLVNCGSPADDGSLNDNVASIPSVTPGGYDLLVKTQDYYGNYTYLPQVLPVTVDASGADVDVTVTLQDAVPLAFTSNPGIDSTNGLAVGDTLTADDGIDNSGATTTSYQWYRSTPTDSAPVVGDLTLIRGATDSTYTLRSGDFGDDVTVRVTHTATLVADGQTIYRQSVSALASTGPVVTSTQGLDTSVYISGNSSVGGTLSANVSTQGGPANTYSYQWIRTTDAGSTDIPDATDSSYVVQPADYNTADSDDNGLLSVRVTAVRTGSPDSAPVTSDFVEVNAAAAVVVKKAPTVSGKTSGGATTYTVKPGTYATAGTTEQYDWLVDGTEVGQSQNGAVHFVPTSEQASGSIVVRVSATLAGHVSRVTTLVAHKGTQTPTVSNDFIEDWTAESGNFVGDSLQAFPGDWTFADGSHATGYRYQWYDLVGTKATAIKKATTVNYTITAADLGKKIELIEFADSDKYASGTVTLTTGTVAPSESLSHVGSIDVAVNGAHGASFGYGTTITPVLSGWPSTVKHTYQWVYEAEGTSVYLPIAKATKLALTIPATYPAGGSVELIVSSTLAGYDIPAMTSAPVTISDNIQWLTAPSISPAGAATVGEKLTAVSGTSDLSTAVATYTWIDITDNDAPDLATGKTYTVTAATSGHQIGVVETWTKAPLQSTAQISDPVMVYPAPTTTLAPSTDVQLGSAVVGTPVQAPAAPALWSGIPDGYTNYKVTYQWNLAGKAISKATASSYTPLSTQVGKGLSVTEKFSSTGYTAAPATTLASTVALASAPTFTVTATQNSTQTAPGVTLTAAVSNPSTTGLKYTYQWVSNAGNNTFTPIPGATKSTYVVPASPLGYYVEVVVTATKAGYANGVVSGNAAFYVGGIAVISAVGAAELAATPTVGTAEVVNATFDTTKDVTRSYQWMLDGVDIPGATTATFVPTADQLTQGLSVRVTASEPGYYSATITSNELAVVQGAAPTIVKKPTIAGSAATCAALSVTGGAWTIAGVTVSYQWYRGTGAIDGAVGATYQPSAADNGLPLHVVLTATSTGYAAGTYTTAATANVAQCS